MLFIFLQKSLNWGTVIIWCLRRLGTKVTPAREEQQEVFGDQMISAVGRVASFSGSRSSGAPCLSSSHLSSQIHPPALRSLPIVFWSSPLHPASRLLWEWPSHPVFVPLCCFSIISLLKKNKSLPIIYTVVHGLVALENPINREARWAAVNGSQRVRHDWVTKPKHMDLTYTEQLMFWNPGQITFSSVQFSWSVVPDSLQPGTEACQASPVHHQLPEFTQTHVHWVSDAIQPSHPPSHPSPAFNLSQHQGLFQGVSSSHEVAKVLEFQLQHQSFQWTHRTDLL